MNEFLWGYPSILLTMDGGTIGRATTPAASDKWGGFDELWEDSWDDDDVEEQRQERDTSAKLLELRQFGVMVGRNGSVVDQRTVHTGQGDLSKKGLVVAVGEERGSHGDWAEERSVTLPSLSSRCYPGVT